MNKLLTLIIILFGSMALAQERTEFTLNECVDYAMENAEALKLTELEKQLSEAVVSETRGIGLPQVSVGGGLNYNFEIQKSLIDLSNFDPNLPEGTEGEIAFGQSYDGNVALNVQQLIFDGSYFVALQAANTYRELAAKEHVKTTIDIIESVSKSYYAVLINRERLELMNQNFGQLDTLIRETQAMYENGFAEKIDVDRLRVNLNNLKVERDRLERLTDLSLQLLKFQMGMPLEQELILTESLDDIDLSVPQVEDFSYSDRIEISQIETNQRLTMLDMKNNRVGRLPKLYGGFNYGYNTATSDASQWFQSDRWLNFGSVGVTLSFSIFDGLIRESKIQQNKIQLEQLGFQKQLTQKNIDIEIQQSTINLNSSLEGLDVQEENMDLAQDVYDITTIKFQEGVGSNLEVLNADTSLKEAQTNYYQALYDAILAKIELLKAQGRLYKS